MRRGRITPFLLMIAIIVGFGVQGASAGLFSIFRHDDASEQSGNGDDDDKRCWFCPPDAPIRPIANAIGVSQQAGLPEDDDDAELQSQTEDLDSRLQVMERDLTRLTLLVEAVLGETNPAFKALLQEQQSSDENSEEGQTEENSDGAAFISPQHPQSIARPPAPPAELEIIR